MSINKIFLRDLKDLKEDYKKDPIGFKTRMKKADVLIGSDESLKFIEKIKNENETR